MVNKRTIKLRQATAQGNEFIRVENKQGVDWSSCTVGFNSGSGSSRNKGSIKGVQYTYKMVRNGGLSLSAQNKKNAFTTLLVAGALSAFTFTNPVGIGLTALAVLANFTNTGVHYTRFTRPCNLDLNEINTGVNF